MAEVLSSETSSTSNSTAVSPRTLELDDGSAATITTTTTTTTTSTTVEVDNTPHPAGVMASFSEPVSTGELAASSSKDSAAKAQSSHSNDKMKEKELLEKLKREKQKQKSGSAISMKKVNEAVAAWSGVDLVPFPGIPIHDCKEKIIEDKLSEWLGGAELEEIQSARETASPTSGPASPRSPRAKKSGMSSPVSPKIHGSGTKSPTHVPGPKDIKQRHAEIESKVAAWAGVPEEILADPKNPQSSAVAFPGIRLHVIKDKEDRLHEIEENVAAWAGVENLESTTKEQ